MSRLFCGITLITVPTIAYGGYFLLTVLSGWQGENFTGFQRDMFRAGHAHAGVLVILSLVAELLVDHSAFSKPLNLAIRIAFPLAAIMLSGGFFAAASTAGSTSPNKGIIILYIGVGLLVASVVTLGVGLLRKPVAQQ